MIYRTGGRTRSNQYTTDAISHTLQTQKQKVHINKTSTFKTIQIKDAIV
jgi:hypothetical protein